MSTATVKSSIFPMKTTRYSSSQYYQNAPEVMLEHIQKANKCNKAHPPDARFCPRSRLTLLELYRSFVCNLPVKLPLKLHFCNSKLKLDRAGKTCESSSNIYPGQRGKVNAFCKLTFMSF